MAQVPLRMAQPSLVPPHQQRPPMMVSMTQPPPVSMQGLVSMAPMMGPGGGMAVMTQAMNHHPDSGHDHHTMNGPYPHHHHHHPHHPHGAAPRQHGPTQAHHPVPPPPPHPSGLPPHTAPPHSQFHPHPGAPHHVPHSVHHSIPHSVSHSHSGPHPPPHISNHSSSNSNSNHNAHGHQQPHLQSGPSHLNQPSHSLQHHSPHQIPGMTPGNLNSNHHNQHHHQHHTQHPHHHQPMHQQMQHSQISQQPQSQPPQQHHQHPSQHQVLNQPQQHAVPQSVEGAAQGGGMILMNSSNISSCNSMNMINGNQSSSSGSNGSSAVVNGISSRGSSGTILSNVDTSESSNSVSIREKTPMCLINELARYNKISHQYCLTDEKGPAHKKIFTVTLKLGDEEEYSASGPSIKKAQHLAAAISLEKTKFKHPPPKTQRQNKQTKLTPTVELNALAMKRGEAAVYTFMDHPRSSSSYAYNVTSNLRTVYQKFYGRSTVYPLFFVSLRVGTRDFGGEGATAQQAKHNAASKALKVIKALPMPDASSSSLSTTATGATSATSSNSGERGAELSELDPNADLKSPISLVHEIALKRSLTVSFEVVRESGPPHMRTFVTTCIVGEIRTQGEGTGKKVSKKRAAELMLEELKKLPPVTSSTLTRIKRKPTPKKKSRNLIKVGQEEQKAAPEYGQGINPISRLIQIQQAKKEKEPIYTLVAERGVPRRREFVVQVTVGSNSAQGSGPNKKLAKRAAAESMLQLLGYSRPQPQPAKPAIKMDGSHSDTDKTRKQVTFLEESDSRSHGNENAISSTIQTQSIPHGSGRQLVPGLIMMPDGSALHGYQQMQQQSSHMNNVNVNQMVNMQATAAIAKELLESGSSSTAKALTKNQTNSSQSSTQSHSGNHQMVGNSQNAISHQPSSVVSKAQQPMQPILNHQPIIQTNSGVQNSQKSQQQNQPQQQNSIQHSNIQTNTAPITNKNGINNSNNNNNNNNNKIGNASSSSNTVNNKSGSSTSNETTTGHVVRPKDHLMYLANILNLQVQFTDIPKGNKSEYLSLVSLSTSPPHVYHGSGPTVDASQDEACLNALKALAEVGLDSVTT